MHAENFLINQGRDREAIEHVTENAPESDGVASFALVVEAVDAVDLSALVVAAEQEEVLGVLNFIAEQKADGFN